jgi:AcrR family transcriptional regulator
VNSAVENTRPMRRRSQKGENSAKGILLAAESLLIDEGYHNFSLRKVAARAEQTLGSLQYYFPTKNALVKAMLDNRIQRYLVMFEQIRASAGADPIDQFKALISGIVRDLNTKTTTVFFPEVWAMANHDEQATEFMDAMYGSYRDVLVDVIRLINPNLSQRQLTRLAIYISASLEGHTMFIGHRKRWKKETENIISMASLSFLWLIQSGEVPT